MKVTDGVSPVLVFSSSFFTLVSLVLSLPVIVTVIVSPAPIVQFSSVAEIVFLSSETVIPLLLSEIVTSLTVTPVGILSVNLNVPSAIPSFLIVIVYVTSFSSPLI